MGSSINSRILKDFHVLKENFKTFFSITVRDIYIPVVINENSKVKVMYGVFLVYLSLRPSSRKLEPTPVISMATPLIRVIFLAH